MTEKGMFSVQREGTVLKGRGRSQCGGHENEEPQVDRGLAELSCCDAQRPAEHELRWTGRGVEPASRVSLPPFVKGRLYEH